VNVPTLPPEMSVVCTCAPILRPAAARNEIKFHMSQGPIGLRLVGVRIYRGWRLTSESQRSESINELSNPCMLTKLCCSGNRGSFAHRTVLEEVELVDLVEAASVDGNAAELGVGGALLNSVGCS
jgi:hypothetical protein